MTELLPPKSCVVHTPKALATAMVKAVGDAEGLQWLEPGFGDGIFVQAMKLVGVPKHRITAIDIDPNPGKNDQLAMAIRGREFLRWAFTTRKRFHRIVGNPPYVALSRLQPAIQQAAQSIRTPDGKPVPVSANAWYAFLCASLRILAPGGALAFVLPAAWDYADYAAHLRISLPVCFSAFDVYRCSCPLFDSVQDGNVVIIAEGFGNLNVAARRWECRHRAALIRAVLRRQPHSPVSTDIIRKPHLQSVPEECSTRNKVQVGDVFDIRLGGVTGDSRYFLLTEGQRRLRRLPKYALVPVLSKARHLSSAIIGEKEWRRLLRAEERVWLFSPCETVLANGAVSQYLDLAEEGGGCHRSRFKILNRDPWYRTPLPRRIQGFLSGMSKAGPFVAFRQMPRLTATNTLYVVRLRRKLTEAQMYAWALMLLTTQARDAMKKRTRVYADGLEKYEPGDICRLFIPTPQTFVGAKHAYVRAVNELLAGDEVRAKEIADQFAAGDSGGKKGGRMCVPRRPLRLKGSSQSSVHITAVRSQ